MKSFIFATHNEHKVSEVNHIFQDADIVFKSLKSVGFEKEIIEDGATMSENAWIKANEIHDSLGGNVVAEDSGLEIKALGDAPGIYSARYAGEQRNDLDNIKKVLKELLEKEDRTARFRAVLAVWYEGEPHEFQGIVKGKIAHEIKGKSGFGYDPIFIPDGFALTFAEMSPEEKNSMSHRYNAFSRLRTFLQKIPDSKRY